jgi:hypothetical protein
MSRASRAAERHKHVNKYGNEGAQRLRAELARVAAASGVNVTRIQKYLKGQQNGNPLSADEQSAVDTAVGDTRLPSLRNELRLHL